MKWKLFKLLLLVTVSEQAWATLMYPLPLDQLVGRGDDIFVGKVISQESRQWRRHIVTDNKIKVMEVIDGKVQAGDILIVRTMTGSVAGLRMAIAGAISFTVGEESLLFTEVRGAHRYVVAMSQGRFPIERRKEGMAYVHRATKGLKFVQPLVGKSQLFSLMRVFQQQSTMPLRSFIKEINRTLNYCGDKRSCKRVELR